MSSLRLPVSGTKFWVIFTVSTTASKGGYDNWYVYKTHPWTHQNFCNPLEILVRHTQSLNPKKRQRNLGSAPISVKFEWEKRRNFLMKKIKWRGSNICWKKKLKIILLEVMDRVLSEHRRRFEAIEEIENKFSFFHSSKFQSELGQRQLCLQRRTQTISVKLSLI